MNATTTDLHVRKTDIYFDIFSNINLNVSCSAVHWTFAQYKRDFSKRIDLYVSLYNMYIHTDNRIRYVGNRVSSNA